MATAYRKPTERERDFKPKAQPDMDREALRRDINDRYAATLRYLGR